MVTVAFEPGAPVVVSPTVTETLPLPAPFCPFRFGVVIDPFLSVMVSLYSVPVLIATETVGLTPSAPFAPCGPGVPSAEMPVSVSPVIQCFVALSIWGVIPGWPGVPGAPASPGSPFWPAAETPVSWEPRNQLPFAPMWGVMPSRGEESGVSAADSSPETADWKLRRARGDLQSSTSSPFFSRQPSTLKKRPCASVKSCQSLQ